MSAGCFDDLCGVLRICVSVIKGSRALVLSPRTRLVCNLSAAQPAHSCLEKRGCKCCSPTQQHSLRLIPAIEGFPSLSCQSVVMSGVPAAAGIGGTPMSQMALLSAYFTNFRDLLAFAKTQKHVQVEHSTKECRAGFELGELTTASPLQMHAGTRRMHMQILFL